MEFKWRQELVWQDHSMSCAACDDMLIYSSLNRKHPVNWQWLYRRMCVVHKQVLQVTMRQHISTTHHWVLMAEQGSAWTKSPDWGVCLVSSVGQVVGRSRVSDPCSLMCAGGPGSIPRAETFDSVFYLSRVGKMSSSQYVDGTSLQKTVELKRADVRWPRVAYAASEATLVGHLRHFRNVRL